MIHKEGKYVANARVDVDYSKGKPKINFDYPTKNPKRTAIFQGQSYWAFLIIFILIGVIPPCLIWGDDIIKYSISQLDGIKYPEECYNLSLDKLNYNYTANYTGDLNFNLSKEFKTVYGFNLTCDNETHIFKVGVEEIYEGLKDYWKVYFLIWLYSGMVAAIGLNILLTMFLNKMKWYRKWLPKANADGVLFKNRRKKYAKFTKKDILNKVIVIPYFNNVELDYKTKGEFSKNLVGLKIREYRKKIINIKSKKISKEKVSSSKWYAIFFFKEKPKSGYLEVIYQ